MFIHYMYIFKISNTQKEIRKDTLVPLTLLSDRKSMYSILNLLIPYGM